MPPKKKIKVKVSDKERMRNRRANMSKEEKEEERKKNRDRMKRKREEMSALEKEEEKAKDRARKPKKTCVIKERNNHYIKHEKEYNRLYKIKIRSGRSEAEQEYEIIYNLLCMRRLRNSRTGKEHLLDNLKAKRGMRSANERAKETDKEISYSVQFQQRSFRDINEVTVWKKFVDRGKEYACILEQRNPEMAAEVKKILDSQRREREAREAILKEREERGFWEEDNNNPGQYWWTGKEPPGPEDPDPNNREYEQEIDGWEGEMSLTEKEWDELQSKWYWETVAERRQEEKELRNQKARENYKKRKEALSKPIIMPEVEVSEYEKIREQNIKERDEAFRSMGYE